MVKKYNFNRKVIDFCQFAIATVWVVLFSLHFKVFDNAESSGKLSDEIRNEVFISTYGSLRLYFRVEGDSNVEAFHVVALGNFYSVIHWC